MEKPEVPPVVKFLLACPSRALHTIRRTSTLVKVTLPALSIAYIGVLLAFTHGQLMYGGDYPGIYNLYDVVSNPTPYVVFQGAAVALAGGNVYVGFYLALFASSLACTAGIYLAAKEVLALSCTESNVRVFGLIGAGLYLITPLVISDSYLSIASNISIPTFGTILFLLEYIRLWKAVTYGSTFSVANAAWMGVGTGISLQLLPTNIRILFVTLVLLLFLFVVFVLLNRPVAQALHRVWRSRKTILAFAVSIAAVGSYSAVLTLLSFPELGATISAGSTLHAYSGFYTGSFNQLPNSLRLIGTWGFPATGYSGLYYGTTPAGLAAYFWPALALGAPLVLWTNRAQRLLLPLLAIAFVVIFWDKGANPPFGGVWEGVASVLPGGYDFLPTFFLSTLLLSKLYVLLATHSLSRVRAEVGKRIHRWDPSPSGAKRANLVATALTLALIFLLAAAVVPLWNGQAETYTWNYGSARGVFTIPGDYTDARDSLQGSTGSILLLPGVGSYVRLAWGYYGSSAFYNEFFLPLELLTPTTFGGTYASASALTTYAALTEPLNTTNESQGLNPGWLNLSLGHDVTFLLIDYSMVLGNLSSNSYVNNTVAQLQSLGLLSAALYHGTDLAVYGLKTNADS